MHILDSSHRDLTGPADIIASLPGILGFYPQESIVLLGLDEHDDPNCVTLGPVLRADLTYVAEVCASLDDFPLSECIAVYAVIISRIPNSGLVNEAAEAIYGATSTAGLPLVDACWHVSEVAPGTPYRIMFGPGPDSRVMRMCGDQWFFGTVSSVMASPAMYALHRNNALPELNREDTFRFFDPVPTSEECDHADRESLTWLAMKRGLELCERLDRGDEGASLAVRQGCEVLCMGQSRPIVEPWDTDELADLLGEADDRLALATLLSRSTLRDRLLVHALDAPLSAAHALLSVAKTFTSTVRANALSAWAVIALERGLTSWALAALVTAQQELPGHSLSEILITLIHNGCHDELVDVIRDGSLAGWAKRTAEP
ncbi:DUF4192 domain-containing protein [Corynebacterium sp. LK2510]|uniref:DUF4192 domain-containing protein n=1 Tax=Corynebacterium sp. LK2510 TaxID=3110472 RepID=UPI0034CD411C